MEKPSKILLGCLLLVLMGCARGNAVSQEKYSGYEVSSDMFSTEETFKNWGVIFETSGYSYINGDEDSVFLSLTEGNVPEPYGLMVRVFPNDEGLTAGDWAQKKDDNYIPGSPLARLTVGGAPAVRYVTYGLEDFDVVAVAYQKKIYVFSGVLFDKKLDPNLNKLLESVRFIRPEI